jgi:hypothetical protein
MDLGGGAGRVSDKLKLSDFIDEAFFEELDDSDAEMTPSSSKRKVELSQVKELVRSIKRSK